MDEEARTFYDLWVIGAQCGLTPEQVLDMNIPMLQAVVEGYQDRLFDQQCLAVWQGYWVGYYQSKKPKPVDSNIKKLLRERRKATNAAKGIPKPEVDVERFERLEAKRKAFLERQKRK